MPVTRRRLPRLLAVLAVALAALVLADAAAVAQFAHHPFAIGGNEGAVGHQSGVGAWILAQESHFYLQMAGVVRATKTDGRAALVLVGLAFAYGVFHAAGVGHGKAVIAAYMVANEVALRRGIVLAGLAAIVQACVATGIIGIAAFVFDASAPRMTASAQWVEAASYCGVIALGAVMVWRKGRVLLASVRFVPSAPSPAFAFAGPAPQDGGGRRLVGRDPAALAVSRFSVDDGSHAHDERCDCANTHMPDPQLLGSPRFDWRTAALAVAVAGARPCSGALLVLIFAFSQGVFLVGVVATFAMAAGTALTVGGLATAAVFAKDVALRLSPSRRSVIVLRLVECVAALAILAFGVALLAASVSLQAA